MSHALSDTSPEVARRTGLHRHNARLLRVEQLHQLRAGQRAIESNRPTPIGSADLKASFGEVDRQDMNV